MYMLKTCLAGKDAVVGGSLLLTWILQVWVWVSSSQCWLLLADFKSLTQVFFQRQQFCDGLPKLSSFFILAKVVVSLVRKYTMFRELILVSLEPAITALSKTIF